MKHVAKESACRIPVRFVGFLLFWGKTILGTILRLDTREAGNGNESVFC